MTAPERTLRAVPGSRPALAAERAADGVVDEWGASRLALTVGRAIAGRRWEVAIGGLDHLPRRGGALLVTNPRPLAMVPPMVALALGERLGRTVRFAGLTDIAPASLVMRRLGGLLALPDEVESALRGGDIVVAGAEPAAREWHLLRLGRDRAAGRVAVDLVAAARRARVPVHPTAALSSPFGRGARVEVAAAVRPRLDRRGPLAATELADRVDARLQERLDEITGGGV